MTVYDVATDLLGTFRPKQSLSVPLPTKRPVAHREDHLIAVQDERLAYFVEAAAATERRHIALSLANTLKSVNSASGPTKERGEADAAEVVWKTAGKALTDCQASNL